MKKIVFSDDKILLNGDLSYKDRQFCVVFADLSRKNSTIDFSSLVSIDYACAILLANFRDKTGAKFINMSEKISLIFALVDDKKIDKSAILKPKRENFFAILGRNFALFWQHFIPLCSFLGEFIINFFKAFLTPKNFRAKELSNYIKDSGINAVFIVLLTSFLIGIVLAYLGSAMLAQFGASIFIVDIMGVLTLREIAPLIGAIVVAGRSASSFAAQIGVMKITEEVDAMKTMGLDPFKFLVLPRVLAMIIALPVVIFLADLVSVFGQMLVSKNILDIGFSEYLGRFKDSIELRHLYVGLVKAPFFGAAIALIGCFRGFEVSQNAQSLGEKTTISVVNAIFAVIAIDSVFAVFFMWYGV
ncbi:MlaE family ABC transporter permease [Campylobacter gastrosuis]|uniref:ABC transporter permease n=1 Tax=Campylobacter gastrosuis TaxID=2974576 RepID=A0ABT7HNZ8_9BACT|nr:ABC transporter permease [Campylobacter gastrosuis]MDL0088657.1 ABC transporter permease [Campylobacter gastrosuis]